MKATLLGYENGYIVNGVFQSNCPMINEEYIPVKVRVQVEGSMVVRDYKAHGEKKYTRVIQQE